MANVDEDKIVVEERNHDIQKLFNFAEEKGNAAIRLCGKLESEISNLAKEEKSYF